MSASLETAASADASDAPTDQAAARPRPVSYSVRTPVALRPSTPPYLAEGQRERIALMLRNKVRGPFTTYSVMWSVRDVVSAVEEHHTTSCTFDLDLSDSTSATALQNSADLAPTTVSIYCKQLQDSLVFAQEVKLRLEGMFGVRIEMELQKGLALNGGYLHFHVCGTIFDEEAVRVVLPKIFVAVRDDALHTYGRETPEGLHAKLHQHYYGPMDLIRRDSIKSIQAMLIRSAFASQRVEYRQSLLRATPGNRFLPVRASLSEPTSESVKLPEAPAASNAPTPSMAPTLPVIGPSSTSSGSAVAAADDKISLSTGLDTQNGSTASLTPAEACATVSEAELADLADAAVDTNLLSNAVRATADLAKLRETRRPSRLAQQVSEVLKLLPNREQFTAATKERAGRDPSFVYLRNEALERLGPEKYHREQASKWERATGNSRRPPTVIDASMPLAQIQDLPLEPGLGPDGGLVTLCIISPDDPLEIKQDFSTLFYEQAPLSASGAIRDSVAVALKRGHCIVLHVYCFTAALEELLLSPAAFEWSSRPFANLHLVGSPDVLGPAHFALDRLNRIHQHVNSLGTPVEPENSPRFTVSLTKVVEPTSQHSKMFVASLLEVQGTMVQHGLGNASRNGWGLGQRTDGATNGKISFESARITFAPDGSFIAKQLWRTLLRRFRENQSNGLLLDNTYNGFHFTRLSDEYRQLRKRTFDRLMQESASANARPDPRTATSGPSLALAALITEAEDSSEVSCSDRGFNFEDLLSVKHQHQDSLRIEKVHGVTVCLCGVHDAGDTRPITLNEEQPLGAKANIPHPRGRGPTCHSQIHLGASGTFVLSTRIAKQPKLLELMVLSSKLTRVDYTGTNPAYKGLAVYGIAPLWYSQQTKDLEGLVTIARSMVAFIDTIPYARINDHIMHVRHYAERAGEPKFAPALGNHLSQMLGDAYTSSKMGKNRTRLLANKLDCVFARALSYGPSSPKKSKTASGPSTPSPSATGSPLSLGSSHASTPSLAEEGADSSNEVSSITGASSFAPPAHLNLACSPADPSPISPEGRAGAAPQDHRPSKRARTSVADPAVVGAGQTSVGSVAGGLIPIDSTILHGVGTFTEDFEDEYMDYDWS